MRGGKLPPWIAGRQVGRLARFSVDDLALAADHRSSGRVDGRCGGSRELFRARGVPSRSAHGVARVLARVFFDGNGSLPSTNRHPRLAEGKGCRCASCACRPPRSEPYFPVYGRRTVLDDVRSSSRVVQRGLCWRFTILQTFGICPNALRMSPWPMASSSTDSS